MSLISNPVIHIFIVRRPTCAWVTEDVEDRSQGSMWYTVYLNKDGETYWLRCDGETEEMSSWLLIDLDNHIPAPNFTWIYLRFSFESNMYLENLDWLMLMGWGFKRHSEADWLIEFGFDRKAFFFPRIILLLSLSLIQARSNLPLPFASLHLVPAQSDHHHHRPSPQTIEIKNSSPSITNPIHLTFLQALP